MSILAENITKYRENANLTQKQLAGMLDVSQTVVARYERGNHSPTSDRLAELADILGVSADVLLGRVNEK